MEDRKGLSAILSDWYSLPELVKLDILLIEKEQSQPAHQYHEGLYKNFIIYTKGDDFSIVTTKFRKLKSHLFNVYC